MAFEDIPPVPRSQELLDNALRLGRQKAGQVSKRRSDTPVTLQVKKEKERYNAIVSSVSGRLESLPKRFPSIDTLNEFYRELLSNDVDLDALREKLARMQNTSRALKSIRAQTRKQLANANHVNDAKAATKVFIGRTSAAIDRLDDDLRWLEEIRKRLRTYPRLKEMPTVCIAGFPNVGKTTLLTKLTGANAEINEYAFTTKSLNLGYAQLQGRKVQFVDTPGTLNRDHMNAIERQAHLALKYVADVIVYVFDLTQAYPLDQQIELRTVMEEYGIPVLEYLSKTDLVSEEQIRTFDHPDAITSEEALLAQIDAAFR